MSKKAMFWLFLLLIVLSAGAVAAIKMKDRAPEALSVQTEAVERMEIIQTVTAIGRIQPQTRVNISADVSGKITLLAVAEGQRVEKGDLLAELDRERPAAALASAEASLRVANSNGVVARENMAKAKGDFRRAKELQSEGLETQAGLEATAAVYEADKARHAAASDRVAQSRAGLRQAKHELSKTRIIAPMSGTVSKLNKEVGEIALGSQFQEDVILVIANLTGMEAEVRVDENDIIAIALADSASIEVDALRDTLFEGEVTEIANTADVFGSGTSDQKTEFIVRVALSAASSQLRPGMTASADIITDRSEDTIGIPIQAVAVRTPSQLGGDAATEWATDRDGFVEVVFVVVDDVVEARQVKTGIQSDTHIEILDGVSVAEHIVIGNYRAISRDLKDGSLVQTDTPVPVG